MLVGTNAYHLYVKVDGVWQHAATVRADDHAKAFRKAMTLLKPEHYDKQIKLEQEVQFPAK
jgi:hypothetical protein